jgi:hypothetical protein
MLIRRLAAGDRELARATFAMMADVFEERGRPLPDDYVDAVLARATSGRTPRSRTTCRWAASRPTCSR